VSGFRYLFLGWGGSFFVPDLLENELLVRL
jgi:hypothetical protein